MRYLKLASNWLDRDAKDAYVYPYWVDLSVGEGAHRVAFAERSGHSSAGGAFPIEEAVLPKWRKHIVSAEGEWLLPYIRRIIAGEEFSEQELVDAFIERHGYAPESYETRY